MGYRLIEEPPGPATASRQETHTMAVSSRMLAVLQKVDAAREQHFAGLRERAKRDRLSSAKRKSIAYAKRKPPKPAPMTNTAAKTPKCAKKRAAS